MFSTVGPLIIGAIGIFWAVHTYRNSQNVRPQEILTPLMSEIDNSRNVLFIAPAIFFIIMVRQISAWQEIVGNSI